MNTKTATRSVHPCPRCGEPVDWRDNPRWKPFCSERCKLIDLGAWFSEEHAIPGAPASENDDGSGTSGSGES